MRVALSLALLATCSGCSLFGTQHLPKTLGESASNYGYVPLDPLPVDQKGGSDSCLVGSTSPNSDVATAREAMPILDSFPDVAIRFAVAELTSSGQLGFGPSKVTVKGNAYRAVLDYVNVDVVPVEFRARKLVQLGDYAPEWKPLTYQTGEVPDPSSPSKKSVEKVLSYQAVIVSVGSTLITSDRMAVFNSKDEPGFENITFPVYVGVGLRLTADIRALEGGINLSGLSVIGAQADAKGLTGTLTVQTLGVTGKPIATALPMPSKLDQTTIENGILALGTSRAVLYTVNQGSDEVTANPRVVGLYSPVGSDPKLINALYSELSGIRVPWMRPCRVKPAENGQPAVAAHPG